MNRRQRKELDLIIEDSRKMLDMCMKRFFESELECSPRAYPEPCNPKIDKAYEFLLNQNIDQYAEKDKAWFEKTEWRFAINEPFAKGRSKKADLFDCCRANNYLTLDEIHKAAVTLWPEKYSFIPEDKIKNEVPNLCDSNK